MSDDPPVRDRAKTLRNTPAVSVAPVPHGLLAIVHGVVATHALPERAVVTVGRARESDIQVVDASVSRVHAQISTIDGITISDLASANGIRIRGELIPPSTPVPVPIGEAMEMGGAILIVQQRAVATREWRIWAHGYFEGRLEDECARVSRAGGSFGLLRLNFGQDAGVDVVQQVLANHLRADDVVGLYGPCQYEVLLVDRSPSEVRNIRDRLQEVFADAGVITQTGLALFPQDGRAADVLAQRAAVPDGKKPEQERASSIVIRSAAMRRVVELVERIAPGDISVLLLGETGVGKEVMAEEVHRQSPRRNKPFLRLNCAALSDTLLESELFGHERGSFTGATQSKMGLLETAQGGTVFLDEIGDLPMTMQVKLLRVLEERKVWRVGGIKPRDIDVRFVSATNRDLDEAIREHGFRQDLYFRLNGIALHIPPLRERREEIEIMAQEFIAQISRHQGRVRQPRLTPEALSLMTQYSWPGNVRELRNAIERAVLLSGEGNITREHFAVEKMTATVSTPISRPPRVGSERPPPYTTTDDITRETMVPPRLAVVIDSSLDPSERLRQEVMEVERQHIVEALARCGGNQTRAAAELGISRRTLISRLQAYNIPRPLKDRR